MPSPFDISPICDKIFFSQKDKTFKTNEKKFKELESAILEAAISISNPDYLPELLTYIKKDQNLQEIRETIIAQSNRLKKSFKTDSLIDVISRNLFTSKGVDGGGSYFWGKNDDGCVTLIGASGSPQSLDLSADFLFRHSQERTKLLELYERYRDIVEKPVDPQKWLLSILKDIQYQIEDIEVETLSWGDSSKYSQKKMDKEKLSLALSHPKDIPNWNEILNRLSHRRQFMAWIWSLFSGDMDSRQILWIHGGGNDGKSTIANVLTEMLGLQIVASFSMGVENQFTNAKFYKKRLTIVPDAKTRDLIANELVFKLSGGDISDIEQKNKTSFSARICTHMLVCSNLPPLINIKSVAEVSRLIYIRISPLEKEGEERHTFQDTKFIDRLKLEFYDFLAKCFVEYHSVSTSGGSISIPEDMKHAISTRCAHGVCYLIDTFLKDHVMLDETKSVPLIDMNNAFIKFLRKNNYMGCSKYTEILHTHLESLGVENKSNILFGCCL